MDIGWDCSYAITANTEECTQAIPRTRYLTLKRGMDAPKIG